MCLKGKHEYTFASSHTVLIVFDYNVLFPQDASMVPDIDVVNIIRKTALPTVSR